MAAGNRGEAVKSGILGSDGTPLIHPAYDGGHATESADEQLEAIRQELRQLSHTLTHLAETSARYAQDRVQTAAQTAVDRYPVGSIVLAALVGYWFAGRRR